MSQPRRGFALFLVLWMVVGIAALALGVAATGRSALRSTTNRVFLTRGGWWAEGCVERLRAAVDDTLRSPAAAAEAGWRSLDTVIMSSPLTAGCDLVVKAVGANLDANAASSVQLSMLLQSAGARPELADSVADAILDWRDADDLTRPSGAESAWYAQRGLLPPRNGAIVAADELLRILGMRAIPGADTLLGVEPGRILVGRASPGMLAGLPGFGPEAVARGTMFAGGDAPADLLTFAGILSPSARSELLAHFAELQQLVTYSPDAWVVTAGAAVGRPPVTSSIEVRLVRAGPRAAVVRRRGGP